MSALGFQPRSMPERLFSGNEWDCALDGHCGHPTGESMSNSAGGTRSYRCCHCGAQVRIPYRFQTVPLTWPHGSHVTRRVVVEDVPAEWSGTLGGSNVVLDSSDG